MTATTTRLPVPEWRVINMLHHNRDRLRADKAMEYADAGVESVDSLVRHGLVGATHGKSLTAVDVLAPAVKLRHVYLDLTASGIRWVEGNPMNVLLRSIDMTPRRQMRLDEVLGFSDQVTVREAVEVGFATLHHAADEREVQAGAGDFAYTHARDFTLNATTKIRRVLA